jgi:CrcB protein
VWRFVWICLGGAVGTGLRYLVSGWALRALGPEFPYGTLAVNVAGSFVLGLVMHVGLTTELLSPELRVVLATGVLGGFTTYSSFNYETLQYLQQGRLGLAAANLGATVLLCLLAGLLGVWAGRLASGG